MRLQFLVENGESSFIEPMLAIMHAMNIKFLPRDQMIPILGGQQQQQPGSGLILPGQQPMGQTQDGGLIYLDPVQILNANPRFVLRAASRMRSRGQLMQILPWLVQTVLNPEVMDMVASQLNQVLDISQLMTLITDTLNIPKFNLFRPMTPQEQQARQQPDPKSMMEMQKQRERLAAQGEMQSDRDETKMAIAFLNSIMTPRVSEDILGYSDPTEMDAKLQLVKAVLQHHATMNRPKPTGGQTSGQ